MAMRGIDLVSAVTILAEIGDLTRFENPRQLMAYLGLVPSERSTGDSVKRGANHQGRQRAGPTRAGRGCLGLSSSSPCRFREAGAGRCRATTRPRDRLEGTGSAVQAFPHLVAGGKKSTVVATAIARELAAFIWAIAREVRNGTPARAA